MSPHVGLPQRRRPLLECRWVTLGQTLEFKDVGPHGGAVSAADAVSLFRCCSPLPLEVRSGGMEGRPREEPPRFVRLPAEAGAQ